MRRPDGIAREGPHFLESLSRPFLESTPRVKFVFAAALGSLAVSACMPPAHPNLISGRHPADASAPVRAAQAGDVTAGFQPYRPVEPADWQELNRRVAPGGAPPVERRRR